MIVAISRDEHVCMNINQRHGHIWFNDKFVEWQDAKVHVLTHGLHYGSAVFEGERSYGRRVFKMHEHHERLLRSARALDLELGYTADEIDSIVTRLLEKNDIDDSYIRPLVWKGSDELGVASKRVSTNFMVAAWRATRAYGYLPESEVLSRGVSLCWADWVRPDPRSAPVQAKAAGLYAVSSICKNKALDRCFDDALLLDYRGFIAESTGANIFFVIDGEVHTPSAHAFLNGITRQTIMEIARKLDFAVYERDIKAEEIQSAKEVFLTGTAAEVIPVGRIENQVFAVGDVTRKLRDAYLMLVNGGA